MAPPTMKQRPPNIFFSTTSVRFAQHAADACREVLVVAHDADAIRSMALATREPLGLARGDG